MNILLVNYKYVYDPRTWKQLRRADGNYSIEEPLGKVVRAHGHTLDVFYLDEAILTYGRPAAREKLWEYISASKPDVCIPVGFDERDWGNVKTPNIKTVFRLVFCSDSRKAPAAS